MLIFIIAFIHIIFEILEKTIGQVEPDPSDVQPELTILKSPNQNLSPWSKGSESLCTVLIEDNRFIASLNHIGRERYLVLQDKSGGKYAGKVVDASDILNCH
jgi:hypothetical protein